MGITKKQWGIGGLIVLAAIILGWAFSAKAPTNGPAAAGQTATTTTATSTPTAAATATTTTAGKPVAKAPSPESYVPKLPYPIDAKDTITSWSFKGGYSGNTTLTAKALADITKLTGLLGKGTYDNYDLYDGIANDYALLGNGTEAYQYYNRAIAIYPTQGLAYTNLAHLMKQLGAYYTAADAYATATHVQPGMLEYHIERLSYLTQQFPNNLTLITAALKDVSNQFGDTAPILSIEAQWLEEQGRYADAVKAWQTVKMLSPGQDMTSVDAAIARDQAKLATTTPTQ